MTDETYDAVNRELYKNPNVPFINFAGSGVPLKLAWIFDKWGMWNPHIIVSEKDIVFENGIETLRHLRAMERIVDGLWDVVEVKETRLPEEGMQEACLNSVYSECEQNLVTSGLSRADAQKQIYKFNAKIVLARPSVFTTQVPPQI